jgi:hypothetical protein
VNKDQEIILNLLHEYPCRTLYEGAHYKIRGAGSGRFYVDYAPDNQTTLSKQEVVELINARLIRQKYAGFYELAAPKAHQPKEGGG